jgi:hypothetical protein
LEHFIFRANNLCEVNLLEVEIVSGFSKNQHGIRAETLKSGTEDFDTRICRDCRGFAWKKEGKSTVGQLDEDGYRIEV